MIEAEKQRDSERDRETVTEKQTETERANAGELRNIFAAYNSYDFGDEGCISSSDS